MLIVTLNSWPLQAPKFTKQTLILVNRLDNFFGELNGNLNLFFSNLIIRFCLDMRSIVSK